MDGECLLDGNVRVGFVKSEFKSAGLRSTSEKYDNALNVLKAWRTEGYVLGKQRVCAGQKFAVHK